MSVNKKIIETEATVPGPENTFNVVTWTGNGTARDITVGFKPDLVWIKSGLLQEIIIGMIQQEVQINKYCQTRLMQKLLLLVD
jgi:hypothetical protein